MHFIISLCASDLTSAMISWLFLYRRTWGFDVWSPLPAIFCKVSDNIFIFTNVAHYARGKIGSDVL